MQPQTRNADAHETIDATALEMNVDTARAHEIKILDGETGAGLEIAATEMTGIGVDTGRETGREALAESVVMTDEEIHPRA